MKLTSSLFIFFFVYALLIHTPWCALLFGLLIGLCGLNPIPARSGALARMLLTGALIGLGFGISIYEVGAAGAQGVIGSLVSIILTLGAALWLGASLGIPRYTALLIGSGTAICGASAIAAVSKVIAAKDDEVAISLATIFSLNAVALFVFPPIGHLLHLTPEQFGIWSGIAIHDTSSVVGAAAVFGSGAVITALPVKLARALWIAPLCYGAAALRRRWEHRNGNQVQGRASIPAFLYFFLLASLAATFIPQFATVKTGIAELSGILLSGALYLVGSGISLPALKSVGLRPLLLGLILWTGVGTGTLVFIKFS